MEQPLVPSTTTPDVVTMYINIRGLAKSTDYDVLVLIDPDIDLHSCETTQIGSALHTTTISSDNRGEYEGATAVGTDFTLVVDDASNVAEDGIMVLMQGTDILSCGRIDIISARQATSIKRLRQFRDIV